MKYIKLQLGRKTPNDKVGQGNTIKTGMTASASIFSAPPITMAAFGTIITTLASKQTARDMAIDAAKAATVDLHTAEAAYDLAVTQLGTYAESAVAGDALKLEGAGFELRKTPQPTTALEQVQGLKVTSNTYEGKLFARWTPLPGALSYELQMAPDPLTPDGWRTTTPCPSTTAKLEELASGTKVWIRVRGVTTKLAGPWSQSACKIVP